MNKLNNKILIQVLLALYFLCALGSFGKIYLDIEEGAPDRFVAALGATVTSVVWPLYWSVEYWENDGGYNTQLD